MGQEGEVNVNAVDSKEGVPLQRTYVAHKSENLFLSMTFPWVFSPLVYYFLPGGSPLLAGSSKVHIYHTSPVILS